MKNLIECLICGELCKGDIGLRNHMKGRKDHPAMKEYREEYMSGKKKSTVKIDYIIPIVNINNDGYDCRLKNLTSILSVIPDFINVVLIEQMVNPIYKLYTKDLVFSKNLNIVKKLVRHDTFNKGWLYNIGVKQSKTEHVILAEGDININRKYFMDLKDFIFENDHKWFFAWNKIIYWNNNFSKKLREDTPRKGMAEGGLVYFNKDFYWSIGGSNEFFQELGGIDNELATRARFMTGKDKLFEGTINHLWHPVSFLKKEKWKLGKHHLTNRTIYYQVRNKPETAINLLKKLKLGNDKSPVGDIFRNDFFKNLNIRKSTGRKRK